VNAATEVPCDDNDAHPVASLLQRFGLMTSSLRERVHELRVQWKGAAQRNPRALAAAVIIFSLLAIASVGGSLWFLTGLRHGMPDESAVTRIGEMDQATHLYDASDKLAFTIYTEQRIEVPIAEVSQNLIQALIAVEDQHFYGHHGFDAVRIALAAMADLRHRRAAQGASTLTQQLARQSFLTKEKTVRRKVQELILAAKIEHLYSKPEILELYLNKVYFGDGLYGVEAASRGYFGKRAKDLTVAEAALLAGLVKSPTSYAPTTNMARAKARRNVVLQAMLENRAIDRAAWQEARLSPVKLADTLRAQEPHGQYFKEQVRRELVDRFGWQRVYQGGLRAFTTIDMGQQIAAETAVNESLKSIDARRKALRPTRSGDERPLQAALVAMDPTTGHVRAMVGGRDFDQSRFNRAVQAKRQPGSAFKPFVYAAALEAGFTPATLISNLNDPIATGQGAWTPEDHSTADAMTLRTGLRTSSNRAAVRLLQQVGIPRTVEYARTMGVGELPNVPSLALGSGEVTLQSLTAAYAAFANHGLVPRPTLIRRVEDCDGHVLYDAYVTPTRAISETTAFLMTNMMADVINAGTGARARQLGFKLPAAGKTGTTNDFKDAWFVGFTPKLVTGVWVGFDQARTILPRGFAADIAVPLWTSFMKVATRNDKPDWFTPPPGVTAVQVCRISGKLAADGCRSVDVENKDGGVELRSMVYTEYFATGTEPTSLCDLHLVSGVYGRIAGMLGADEKPAPPPRVDGFGLAPPPTAIGTTGAGATPTTVGTTGVTGATGTNGTVSTGGTIVVPPRVEDPGTKRGFWSRVFGRGREEPEKPQEPPPPTPKKKGG
jgi:1A family penicillin-binding protein